MNVHLNCLFIVLFNLFKLKYTKICSSLQWGSNLTLISWEMLSTVCPPGTSTDVSRYAGQYEHVFEATTAGVTLQAPQLDINTVAAGGGSRLFFRSVKSVYLAVKLSSDFRELSSVYPTQFAAYIFLHAAWPLSLLCNCPFPFLTF